MLRITVGRSVRLGWIEDRLVVLGSDEGRDLARRQKVRAALAAHGERHEPPTVPFGDARRDRGDDAAVEAAGEEYAERHVRHHPAGYGRLKERPALLEARSSVREGVAEEFSGSVANRTTPSASVQ